MSAEDARAALTGNTGGDPYLDLGVVLEDGPAPPCNARCKGLYGADTLCERPKGHAPPCAPAVMAAAAERESQRRRDRSYARAEMNP